ncbi:MAG TPA: carbohydrate kinase family protein [Candidatus Acidoferrum sp.]|nr:carbohydrate kinase family protein [Candidatus Acidoferrum sp.]
MSQPARPRKPVRIVCIGGANIDIKGRIAGRTAMGSSNPGAAVLAPGGVARNIAENLARLGLGAALVSAVGRDAFGEQLLAATAAAGVDMRGVMRGAGATGSYQAALDASGELIVGIAAMGILERLTSRRLAAQQALLARADLIVADSNLAIEPLDWLIGFAAAHDLRLAIETVSVPKGGKLKRLLARRRPLYALFCNRAEAAALTGSAGLAAAARRLHALGVGNVGIGLGRRGMFVSDGATARIVPALPARVVEATGAGDAAVAGTLYGLLRGHDLAAAARYGQAAAALTLACEHSVNPRLSERAIRRCLRRRPPSP